MIGYYVVVSKDDSTNVHNIGWKRKEEIKNLHPEDFGFDSKNYCIKLVRTSSNILDANRGNYK